MKQTTFAEQYEADKPLRIAAFNEHYKNMKKYDTITDAQLKEKRGECILKVTPLDGSSEFYILHTFSPNDRKMITTGWVIGMWNELTVIGASKKPNH